MTDVQAARMPTNQPYTLMPTASATALAASSASVDLPATIVSLSPEAQQQYQNGQQLVTKLLNGAKQVKADDEAFRLAAAKEKLKELKMLAELAAATGDAKLAKSVAKDLATVSRQLGTLAQDVAQGGGPASSASSAASSDGSGGADTATTPAAATTATASGASTATTTPSGASSSATDEQTVMAEIHSLAVEAKKILDYLRSAPHLRGKADKELAVAAKDVTAAVTSSSSVNLTV